MSSTFQELQFSDRYNPYLRQSYLGPIKSSSLRSSLVQSSPVQSTPLYFISVQTLQSTAVLIFTTQSCLGPFQFSPIQNIQPPTQFNARADFRYQYNSHKDSKAWRRKGPTPHWVFSSLRFRRMRGGWERVSQKTLMCMSGWLVKSLWVGTMEGLLDSALVEP